MDRFYVDSPKVGGFPRCHFIVDRATVPHTVLRSRGRWDMAKRATAVRACGELNASAGDWQVDIAAERDSLVRLREWASRTKAFTEVEYDPNAEPALVRPEAIAA